MLEGQAFTHPKQFGIIDGMKGEKHITTDELARMIQEHVVPKMATKDDFKILVEEIRLLRDDFKDVAGSHKMLVSLVVLHDKDIRQLKADVA